MELSIVPEFLRDGMGDMREHREISFGKSTQEISHLATHPSGVSKRWPPKCRNAGNGPLWGHSDSNAGCVWMCEPPEATQRDQSIWRWHHSIRHHAQAMAESGCSQLLAFMR